MVFSSITKISLWNLSPCLSLSQIRWKNIEMENAWHSIFCWTISLFIINMVFSSETQVRFIQLMWMNLTVTTQVSPVYLQICYQTSIFWFWVQWRCLFSVWYLCMKFLFLSAKIYNNYNTIAFKKFLMKPSLM